MRKQRPIGRSTTLTSIFRRNEEATKIDLWSGCVLLTLHFAAVQFFFYLHKSLYPAGPVGHWHFVTSASSAGFFTNCVTYSYIVMACCLTVCRLLCTVHCPRIVGSSVSLPCPPIGVTVRPGVNINSLRQNVQTFSLQALCCNARHIIAINEVFACSPWCCIRK